MAGQEIQEKYRQERSGGEESIRSRHGQKKRGRREIGPLVLTILFLAALLAAVYSYLQGKQWEVETEGLVYEANVVEGDIPGKVPEERQRELGSTVKKGMLVMPTNATPYGKTTGADKSINWLTENPSNQGELIRAGVWKDDTAEKIYETGVIPPENYVEVAPLSVELPPGEYRCIVRLYAYKVDEAYIGQAAVQI